MRAIAKSTLATLLSLVVVNAAGAFDPTLVNHPLGVVDFEHIPDVVSAGAGWIRVPVEWRFIEPEDDQFNWSSALADWIDEADAEGANVSPVLTVGRMWASGFATPASWPSWPPIDLQEEFDPEFGYSETYYDFISSFLLNYRYRIDRITIENEVNSRNLWMGSMDDYRRMLATAMKARDDVAPEIRILDSGCGSGSWGIAIVQHRIESGEYSPEDILRFANEWYEYDLYAPLYWSSYQDLLYWVNQPFVQRNISNVDFVLRTVPEYVDYVNFKFTIQHWLLPDLIDYIEMRMAESGHAIPPMINNEASNWPLDDPALEGQNLFKMVIVGLSRGVVNHLWFPWSNEVTSTSRRGLLDEQGQITEQYLAFRNIGERLGSRFSFVGEDGLGQGVHRYRFQEAGQSQPLLDAMWWDDGDHGSGGESVAIPLPEGTHTVVRYEYDGTVTTFPVSGGSFSTVVGSEGAFYEYQGAEIGVATAAAPLAEPWLDNVPNPFTSSTVIRLHLPDAPDAPAPFRLTIYDLLGRRIRLLPGGTVAAKTETLVWDGRDDAGHPVGAGVYWYRFESPLGIITERMSRVW